MGSYEELIASLRDEGREEDADLLESLSAGALRKKAAKADELEKELADRDARIAKLESGPLVEQAFRDAGVDLAALRVADREVISNLGKDDLSQEKIAEIVSRYELPLVDGTQVQGAAPPAAAAVVAAARQAPASSSAAASAQITLGDYFEWSLQKRMRFNEAHPQAAEAFKRGDEAVNGIVFS
jgi:hypothetical protein